MNHSRKTQCLSHICLWKKSHIIQTKKTIACFIAVVLLFCQLKFWRRKKRLSNEPEPTLLWLSSWLSGRFPRICVLALHCGQMAQHNGQYDNETGILTPQDSGISFNIYQSHLTKYQYQIPIFNNTKRKYVLCIMKMNHILNQIKSYIFNLQNGCFPSTEYSPPFAGGPFALSVTCPSPKAPSLPGRWPCTQPPMTSGGHHLTYAYCHLLDTIKTMWHNKNVSHLYHNFHQFWTLLFMTIRH